MRPSFALRDRGEEEGGGRRREEEGGGRRRREEKEGKEGSPSVQCLI